MIHMSPRRSLELAKLTRIFAQLFVQSSSIAVQLNLSELLSSSAALGVDSPSSKQRLPNCERLNFLQQVAEPKL